MTNPRNIAPCGCPAGASSTRTAAGPSAYNPEKCPIHQMPGSSQRGTDLQIPLIEAHVRYYNDNQYRPVEAAMSYQSISTHPDNVNMDEGYNRYKRDGLNTAFPMRLTPEDGTSLNELQQFERASLHGKARRISVSLARMVEGEPQYDIDVDENGYAVYPSSHRPVRMGPTYFQAPTGPMSGTMVAQRGNPSSHGQSSSRHTGRRGSHDHRSSRSGKTDYIVAAGDQFADERNDLPSDLSISGYIEEGVFQFEE